MKYKIWVSVLLLPSDYKRNKMDLTHIHIYLFFCIMVYLFIMCELHQLWGIISAMNFLMKKILIKQCNKHLENLGITFDKHKCIAKIVYLK